MFIYNYLSFTVKAKRKIIIRLSLHDRMEVFLGLSGDRLKKCYTPHFRRKEGRSFR